MKVDTPYSYPEQEERPKKGLTIKNLTNTKITIYQLESNWKTVNFCLTSKRTERRLEKPNKFMATLHEGDTIELTFHPLDVIEK